MHENRQKLMKMNEIGWKSITIDEMDENVWKQMKMNESVKTRLKTDENVWKMDENGRNRIKTNENVWKQMKT